MSDPLDLDPTVDGGADLQLRGPRRKNELAVAGAVPGMRYGVPGEAGTRGRYREARRETTSTMPVLALAGEASIDDAARILVAAVR